MPRTVFGPDESRAVEGISALLDLRPRDPGEDDSALARRMADWGLEQGPEVRWAAIAFSALSMIKAQAQGVRYPQLASVGLDALEEYNRSLHNEAGTWPSTSE
jgi:hypothetical protein